VSAGLALDIEFHDGHVGAVAGGGDGAPRTTIAAEPAKPEPIKSKPRRSGGEGQGSLFG
jgi:hypothetical protein